MRRFLTIGFLATLLFVGGCSSNPHGYTKSPCACNDQEEVINHVNV